MPDAIFNDAEEGEEGPLDLVIDEDPLIDDSQLTITIQDEPEDEEGPLDLVVDDLDVHIYPDTSLVNPDVSSVSDCGSPNRQASFVLSAGPSQSILWPVRDADGNVVVIPNDLPDYNEDGEYSDSPHRVALVTPLFCQCDRPLTASIRLHESGRLKIGLPDSVTSKPNFYLLEVVWTTDLQRYSSQSLISVEASLLNRYSGGSRSGPITLSQIRTKLRDFPEFNDLTERFEFSAEEILQAITKPVMYWNEVSPVTSTHDLTSFPYRSHWLDATVSELYQTSAHWMLRNDIQIQAAGVAASERSANKWQYMLNYSAQLWNDYTRFVHR